MNLPDYIRTEWKSRGKLTLCFSSKLEDAHSIKSENSECHSEDSIQVYLSTLNIWEYKEDSGTPAIDSKTTIEQEFDDGEPVVADKTAINQNDLLVSDGFEPLPEPVAAISSDILDDWYLFWSQWGDTLVQFAWIHKFRDLSKQDYIKWHDEYMEHTTERCILGINYCLDIPLESESGIESIKSIDGEVDRELLDALYEEFSKKRYWVHFRLFLKDAHYEIGHELSDFFKSQGIVEEPPKGDHLQTCEEVSYCQSAGEKVDLDGAALKVNEHEVEKVGLNGATLEDDGREVEEIKIDGTVLDYKNEVGEKIESGDSTAIGNKSPDHDFNKDFESSITNDSITKEKIDFVNGKVNIVKENLPKSVVVNGDINLKAGIPWDGASLAGSVQRDFVRPSDSVVADVTCVNGTDEVDNVIGVLSSVETKMQSNSNRKTGDKPEIEADKLAYLIDFENAKSVENTVNGITAAPSVESVEILAPEGAVAAHTINLTRVNDVNIDGEDKAVISCNRTEGLSHETSQQESIDDKILETNRLIYEAGTSEFFSTLDETNSLNTEGKGDSTKEQFYAIEKLGTSDFSIQKRPQSITSSGDSGILDTDPLETNRLIYEAGINKLVSSQNDASSPENIIIGVIDSVGTELADTRGKPRSADLSVRISSISGDTSGSPNQLDSEPLETNRLLYEKRIHRFFSSLGDEGASSNEVQNLNKKENEISNPFEEKDPTHADEIPKTHSIIACSRKRSRGSLDSSGESGAEHEYAVEKNAEAFLLTVEGESCNKGSKEVDAEFDKTDMRGISDGESGLVNCTEANGSLITTSRKHHRKNKGKGKKKGKGYTEKEKKEKEYKEKEQKEKECKIKETRKGEGLGYTLNRLRKLGSWPNKEAPPSTGEVFVFGKERLEEMGNQTQKFPEVTVGSDEEGKNVSDKSLDAGSLTTRKRKRDTSGTSEDENFNEDSNKEVVSSSSWPLSRGIRMWFGLAYDSSLKPLFTLFKNVTSLFFHGTKSGSASVLNWLFPSYYARKEQEAAAKKMNAIERKLLRNFKDCAYPVVRKLPGGSVMADYYLVDLYQLEDDRETKEDLVSISESFNQDEKSGSSIEVHTMTEYDMDELLMYRVNFNTFDVAEPEDVRRTHTIFDDEGNPKEILKIPVEDSKLRCIEDDEVYQRDHLNEAPVDTLHEKINKLLSDCRLLRHSKEDEKDPVPHDIEEDVAKYWIQRHRLFLRFNEGIKLDTESWYSVTPEVVAYHQAERCRSDIVIDAFCGAGGNAIQLASVCNKVIAIDIDADKLALAKHNATVYGVEDRIEFIHGDFFELAPSLKADVVFLSPPWGGTNYASEPTFDIFEMGGMMDAKKMMKMAKAITSNIAIYLPKHSNVFQIIEWAHQFGFKKVDLEYAHISNKRKGLTVYFGDLVYF